MRNLPQRESIRLKNYDYSEKGFYFITICAQNRLELFGKIKNGKIKLNNAGTMINSWWQKIPNKFPGILNIGSTHGLCGSTHGLTPTGLSMQFGSYVGADPCVRPQQKLFRVIHWFKTMTTNYYIRNVKINRWQPFDKRLWQRNYYEHVIRSEKDLYKIKQYIVDNPKIWNRDRNNLENPL